MTDEDDPPLIQDDYIDAATREIAESVTQFSGMDGPQLIATLAGVVVACGRELFERLATVERALSLVDTSTPTRAVQVSDDALVDEPEVPAPLQLVPVQPSVNQQKLEMVRALEEQLRILRGGGLSTPVVELSDTYFEVRHAEGSLAKHVPEHMRVHQTREAAEQALQIISATSPGWRDRLIVEEVTR